MESCTELMETESEAVPETTTVPETVAPLAGEEEEREAGRGGGGEDYPARGGGERVGERPEKHARGRGGGAAGGGGGKIIAARHKAIRQLRRGHLRPRRSRIHGERGCTTR